MRIIEYIKNIWNVIIFKRKREFEKLEDFFYDNLGQRNDYNNLQDIIRASKNCAGFLKFIKMQANKLTNSQLEEFFTKISNKKEDYEGLDTIIESCYEPQETETEEGNKSGIYEQKKKDIVENNLERGIYLQSVHNKLINLNFKYSGNEIKTLYQLIEPLRKQA